MKVVRHDHKFMQQIFSLLAIVEQNVDEKTSHSAGLKNVSFLKRGSGDEVTTVTCIASAWSGHGKRLSG